MSRSFSNDHCKKISKKCKSNLPKVIIMKRDYFLNCQPYFFKFDHSNVLARLIAGLAGVSPRRVAVVREREGPGAQAVEHPQHGQRRADGVPRLDGDQRADLAVRVRRHDLCKQSLQDLRVRGK